MTWRADGPQGNESAKCRWDIVKYTRGRVLDLGCGAKKAFPHFLGVDNNNHAREFGWQSTAANVVVETCEKLDLFADESVDAVFSSHLLEHIKDHEAALREWWRVIKQGGYLVLYLPHKDFYPNMGKPGANPTHVHDFWPQDIYAIVEGFTGATVEVNEDRNEGNEYSFLQVYRKGAQTIPQARCKPFAGQSTACVVRYGGFGDMIQTSTILPGLKKDGYHVTMMTTDRGYDLLKHDPHIDDWFIQEHDQVPNAELWDYWAHVSKKFDRFINLSESVEGTLLALPNRAQHSWPDDVRRAKLGSVNYLDWTHQLAGQSDIVQYPRCAKFYPSHEEDLSAQSTAMAIRGTGKEFIVMWTLSGSSVHKAYPWMDAAIATLLMTDPSIRVVLVGDELCQILEGGWQEEKRVYCRSGVWSIRQTLAFANKCDAVIGPETGVLNAVGMEDIIKIVLMSHSSRQNLAARWPKTTCLQAGPSVPCQPCHRMHYNFDHCVKDEETFASACMAEIPPRAVVDALLHMKATYHDARRIDCAIKSVA